MLFDERHAQHGLGNAGGPKTPGLLHRFQVWLHLDRRAGGGDGAIEGGGGGGRRQGGGGESVDGGLQGLLVLVGEGTGRVLGQHVDERRHAR